jgi:SAM-dependent methyltransferase
MDNYSESTYGERIAGIYDEWYQAYDPAAIRVLSELAHDGSALELGIGTGRIALPLQAAGVNIHGIDVSPAMISRLRAKPGGENIPVTLGNFADLPVQGTFNLIYVLFNTFFALLTQENQLRCFKNVAKHLSSQGVFLIEAFMPDLARFTDRQTIRAISIDSDELRIDASQLDPAAQTITSQHVELTGAGVRLFPVKLRYVWPSELDLMARLAGLSLQQRWEDWERAPFSADSGKQISIYEHAL